MKSITKRIISTLAICGALVLEAGATAIGSLGKALNNIAKVDAADTTASWTATSGAFGSSGSPVSSITDDKNNVWSLTISDSKYLGWSSNHIQVGSKNNPTSFSLTCSSITQTISSISFVGWSYNGLHTYNISVGGTTVKSGNTSSASDTVTVDSLNATGTVVISFNHTSGRAAYLKSFSITYGSGSSPSTTYSINYLKNTTDEVTGMPSAETGLSAGSHTLSTTKPTRSGYDFVGWNTNSAATTGIASVTISSADIDVYAIWKEQGGGGTSDYTLVSDATKLVEGTKFLLTLSSDETKAVAAWPASKNFFGYATASVSGNKATTTDGLIFTLGGTSGSWTIKSDSYYYGLQNSTTALRAETLPSPATNYTWTITVSDGVATMKTGGSGSRYLSWNNNTNDRFSAYSSNCTAVKMYASIPTTKNIASIAVKTAPTKVTYFEGETFNPAGLVITATYDDASTADIAYADSPSDFSFSPSGSLATTNNNVVITYKEKTANQAITVNSDTLNSITLGGSVTGSVSSGWDLSGVVVTGNYESGSRTITDATPTTSTSAPTEFKNYTVSVSVTYKGVTGNKDYNVKVEKTGLTPQEAFTAEEAIAKETSGDVAVYVKDVVTKVDECSASFGNATFWFGNFELYKVKLDSSLGAMANDTIQVGQTVLVYGKIVKYNSTIEIGTDGLIKEISNKEVSSIAVTSNPTNPQYSGKAFDKTGMVVTATYNDSTTDDVTDSVVIEPSTLASNTTSVTIKYTENGITVQKSFSVDVLTLNKITASGYTETFRAGDTFSFGGSVYPWYTHSSGAAESQGAALDSSEYTVSKTGATLERGNDQEVVVTHTASSKTCSYTIDVDYAYVTGVSFGDDSIELGLGGEATFAATVTPELANQQVTYSIDTDNTTLGVGEYTLTGNKLTIAEDIAASGEVHVIATTVGKDSGDQSKSATCIVTVTKAVIAQITAVNVSGAVTATEQYVGKDFDYSGLTFTPVWSEGEHDEVTITGADIDWPELTEGMTSITGKYNTGSAELDVAVDGFTVVNDYLNSIEITGDMTNKTYYSNANGWNFEGLSVTGTNASGDPATITQASVEYTANLTPAQYLSTSAEKLVVTATYGGKTDTIDITGIVVNEYNLSKIEVTSNPTKTEYIIGDAFDPTGMVVKAIYNDSSEEILTSDQYTVDVDMFAHSPSEDSVETPVTVKMKGTEFAADPFNITISKFVPETTTKYVLVEDASKLQVGDEVILYAEKDSSGYVSGAYESKYLASINGASVTNKVLTLPEEGAQSLTLGKDGDYWTLSIGSDKIGTSAAKALSLNSGTTTWTISISGVTATISSTNTACGRFLYNASSPRFLNYTSDTTASMLLPSLYKEVSEPSGEAELVKLNVSCAKTFKEGETLNISDLTILGLYNSGEEKAITSGVTFSDGTSSKVLAPGDNNLTVMYGELTENITITATSLVKYDLSVSINSDQAEYTVSPALTDGKLIGGEDYSIEVSAKEGYVIESVTATGATVSGNVVTITNASSDVSIIVTSRALTMFSVTDSTDTYTTLSNTATQVKEGTTYESDVTFATGKELDTVSVTMGGVEVTGAYSNGHIKVENVSGDLVISITSKDVYFDVEYNFNHVSGEAISPETSLPEKVVYNGSVSFKVEPESGYEVDTGHIMVKEDGAAKTFSYDSTTGILTVSNVTNALEIAIDAFKLADVTKDLGDGLSISHESSPVSINGSYTLELSLADGKEITSVSVKMGEEPVDNAWNASTLTVYIPNVTNDIEIVIETATIQVPINANGNIKVDPEVKGYGSENVTVTVSPEDGYVIVDGSLYYTIGDDVTHHTITGNSFVIDSLTEEINVYGEAIAVFNLSYDLTDLTHSEADPYIQKDLDTFEIVLEVDGDKSNYGIDMTTFKVEMGDEDITGDITKVVYTHDKANGKLTINLVVAELTGDIKVTAARGARLFDVSVTGQTDLVDVTGDLEIAYDSTGSITFTPADHYHFEANGIQVVNSGSAEVSLNSQPDGSVILYLTGVKGDVSITVAVEHDLVSVTTGTLEHITFNFTTVEHVNIEYGTAVTGHFTAEFGYERPISITVTCYGELLPKTDYAYNQATGVFSIYAMGDIVISAKGAQGQVEVVATGDEHVSFNDGEGLPTIADSGLPFIATVEAEEGYKISSIVVTMNGSEVLNAYNEATGTITIQSVNENINIVVTTVKLHSVEYDIENVTISDYIYEVVDNGTYTLVILVNDGYELKNGAVSVTMGEEDVTGDVLGEGVIFISQVTGDVQVSIKATKKSFSVTNTLTNASNSNAATTIEYGASYQAVISAVTGYENLSVTVKMGGADVTSAYYSNGVIIIPKVTGDIEVIATASIIECNITWNLDHVTSEQSTTDKVNYGSNLEVVLEEAENYFDLKVTVTVNGVPVSVTLDEDSKFTLSNITGDVVITASATKIVATHIEVSMVDNEITYNTDLDDFIGVIIVELHYNDDSYETLSEKSVTGYNKNQVGAQTLAINAAGFNAELEIVVVYSDTILSISAEATKDNFTFGETFDNTNVVVTATYDDTHTAVLKDIEVIGYDITKSGSQTLTIKAGGKQCTLVITVKASTVIDYITAVADSESYAFGYTLTTDNFTATATYTDGKTAAIGVTSIDAANLVPGLNVVQVYAGGKSCNVVVKVLDSTVIDSISAVIKDGKDTVAYEGAFTADDVTVYATYTDSKTKVVTGFTMSGFDNKHIGVNTVTISLGDKTCTVKVTVLASTVVDHIEATATKDNLTYGDTFTKDDVKVTEVYTDGHKVENLAADSISGFTGAVGVNNVTVVYGDKEATIQVTVKASEVIESIEAVVNEGKAELEYGAAFTKDDVTVTATYTDGNTEVVAADSVDFAGTVGENTVVVHVGDKTCEVTVTVKASEVITGIEVSTEKTNVEYGGTFTKDDVKAQYVYSDGHKVDATVDSISGFSATTLGKQVITVKVGEYSATLEITVSGRVALSIEVIGYNDTVDQGKDYVFTGKVIAHYNDGTIEEVTAYTMEAVDTSKAGKKTVKVSFENVSATFDINVIQTKTEIEPTYMTAIIGGSVVGVAILAVGIFLFLKSFKL